MTLFDRERVAAEIQGLGNLLLQNLESREGSATTALFSKDIVITSDGAFLDDYEMIMSAWEAGNAGITRLVVEKIEAERVQVLSEDHGIHTVKFYETMDQDGESITKQVTWTNVFQKEDGRWAIINSAGMHIEIQAVPD